MFTLSFQNKILLIFGSLLLGVLLFTFLVVNNQVKDNAKSNIYKNFLRTETAFEEFKSRRLDTIASEIYSVTSRNPRFFSILAESAHQTGDRGGDLGFDTATSKGSGREGSLAPGQSNLPDLHRLLLSLLPDTALYRRSDIFIVVNLRGTLLFNKTRRSEFGNDLSLNPVVAAVLSGRSVPFFYATPRSFFGAGVNYDPPLADRIEQIIVMPVTQRHNILGAVIVGDAARPFVSDVKGITDCEIVLSLDSGPYLWTLDNASEKDLERGIVENERLITANTSKISEISLNNERFLILGAPLSNFEEYGKGRYFILRSLDRELQFLRRIQYNVLIIGLVSFMLALFGSFLFARSITRPVKALVRGAGEIGKGNFDFSFDVKTGDELGTLGRSFEEMARGLKEREFIKSTFARYVSADVVSELIRNPEKVTTGGEKKTLTVLFSDLAGFTPVAEAMDAAALISLLNEYLERITDVIFRCGGTIDKFLGDGVMAFWGAPVPSQRHGADACLAALECRKALETLRTELGARGLPQLQVRFGINTGEMIVGNVGSRSRLDYTVVGDEVNLASRLEAVNKRYGTRILISENTFREAGDCIVARELDRIRVTGKAKPVVIYELLAGKGELPPDYTPLLPLFERGLNLYRERSFPGASEMFDSALQISPKDGPSCEYLARCRYFQEFPPADDWDGTLDLPTK